MNDVNKPAVLLGKEGQATLRGRCHIHEIDVTDTVIDEAVDIGGKEEQADKEFQASEIILDRQADFIACGNAKGKHHQGDMKKEILCRDDPHPVKGGRGRDQERRRTAKQAAWEHKGKKDAPQLFIGRKVEDHDKDDLDRAKVEGQIGLWQDTAVCSFVSDGVIKDLDGFGYKPHTEHDLKKPIKFQPLGKDKENRYKNNGSGKKNKMLCAEHNSPPDYVVIVL